MAKITFSKLNVKSTIDVKMITFNEQEIEVKQYLPVEKKLELAQNVINMCQDVEKDIFFNKIKFDVYVALEMIYAYTNITFTDKQKENPQKLYDALETSGLLKEIFGAIPSREFNYTTHSAHMLLEEAYRYRTSILGVLDSVANDYNGMDLDITEIQKKMNDPKSMELLKNTLTKLG